MKISLIVSMLFVSFIVPAAQAIDLAQKSNTTKAVKVDLTKIPEKRDFPIDESVNPCEDFHAYTCNKAEANFQLRSDRSRHTFSFDDSRERILDKKKNYFLKFDKLTNLDQRTQQIQDLYKSCMNVKAKTKSEKSEVKDLSSEIAKLSDLNSFLDFQISHQNHLGSLYGYFSNQNPNDPDKLDIVLHANLMRLHDHKYYEDDKLITDYQNYLEAFLKITDPNAKNTKERALALVQLEKDFVKIFPVANVRRQRWSENRTEPFDAVVKKYPKLKLAELLKLAPRTAQISTPIPEALDFLQTNFEKYSLQTWKDRYLLDNLSGLIDDSNSKFFNLGFELNKKYFGGPVVRPNRQERCTKFASGYFPKEFEAHFIDQVFPNFNDKPVYEVGQKIRESIIQGLKDNKWLSSDARKAAIKKMTDARLQLVKPQNDREWDFFPIKTYSKTDYAKNLQTHQEAEFDRLNKELSEPANKDAWGMGPLTVNAYYSGGENKFVLPVGILQYPFYIENGSLIENLGAVGTVFAHEMGHGIDDQGSKYDSTGKLNPWMPFKDVTEFNKRSAKLVDQYNKADHDGKLTLGENTADLVGVTFAFAAAFPESVRKNPSEKDLADFRKFFTAFGRLWCEVIRPDNAKLLRKTDPHASGVARVNEQVKQQPAFAKAFNCKPTDKMVLPESERVQIW